MREILGLYVTDFAAYKSPQSALVSSFFESNQVAVS